MKFAKLKPRFKDNKAVIMACLFGSFLLPSMPAFANSDALTIYAGPQSVAPDETIYVSVGVKMEALSGTPVTLSYNIEGMPFTLIKKTEYGVASFGVLAQKNAGQMRFKAQAEGMESEPAIVSVMAGSPKAFDLIIKRGGDNTVDIFSNVITDEYNNAVSALSLVSLDWIDGQGLKSSQNAYLSRGAIELNSDCPAQYVPPLRIRASVNSASYTSLDLSRFCQLEED